jgi:hypothetical protein
MRKIRLSVVKDEDLTSKNIFLNKKNWKWYVFIAPLLSFYGLSQVILMDLYRSGLNIADVYYTLARVLGNAGLILDTRPKNKPTLTSTGIGL